MIVHSERERNLVRPAILVSVSFHFLFITLVNEESTGRLLKKYEEV